MIHRTCACPSFDRFECWSLRYSEKGRMLESIDAIEADGGPCECCCHDPDPDDDVEWP